MAEEKKEEQIYDGVGCPKDGKSEKTIFRPLQKDPHTVTSPDGSKEQRKVLPSHSTHHEAKPSGIPVRKEGDTDCDMGGGFDGPVIRRQPPKDQAHPEKKEEKKTTPGFG